MNNLTLKNKNILITGGSQGVGFAIAKACCSLGAKNIVLIGRDDFKGQNAAKNLSTKNTKASFLKVDLFNDNSTDLIFDFTSQEIGSLDCLVNAAGITTRGSFLDGKVEDWNQFFKPFLANN